MTESCCIGIAGSLVFIFTVQSASPSRLSHTSDGSASSVPSTVTADLDSSLQQGSSSSVKKRLVSEA